MGRDVHWQSQDDTALLAAIRQRDEGALRELVNRYSAAVFSVCRRMLRGSFDAEEVTGDIFSELWQHSARFDPTRSSAKTYILLLTRSRCLDRLRAASRNNSHLEPGVDIDQLKNQTADSPEQTVKLGELTIMIAAGLDQLSEPQRAAIQMAFFDGLTHREIADATQAPLGSVKSHIRRGLAKLRQLVAQPERGED